MNVIAITNKIAVLKQKIEFAEVSEQKLEEDKQQILALILNIETIGNTHFQYCQLTNLNQALQETVNQLNGLSDTKNKLLIELNHYNQLLT